MSDGWVICELRPDGERRTTRGELGARAARLAAWLDAHGVGAGDSVAYYLENSIAVFEIQAACQLLGAFAVPINYHSTADETRHVLADSAARAVITRLAHAAVVAGASRGLACDAARLLAGGESAGFSSYEQAIADTSPWSGAPREIPGVVIYTSGTTGRPKGVRRGPRTPESMARAALIFAEVCRMGPAPVHLCTGPLYHAAPVGFANGALNLGGRLVLFWRFDAEATLAAIERFAVTNVHLVPTMMVRLLALPDEVKRRYDLSSLVTVQHAAAPCPPAVKRAMIEWWGPVIEEYYGSTETGVSTYIRAAEALQKPGSVGRAIEGVVVEIHDEQGHGVAPGTVGDVFIGNSTVAGFDYHGDAEKRARAMHGELFTCGDVGWLDADGYLFLCDRRADMIISGGVNIYPAEIEAALAGHPAVYDAAVFGIPDDEWGEAVHAAIQLVPDARATAAEIVVFLGERLSRFKLPRSIDFVAELPREPSGKIFKRKLREPFWRGKETAIG